MTEYLNNNENKVSHIAEDGMALCGWSVTYGKEIRSNPAYRICGFCKMREKTLRRQKEMMCYIIGFKRQYRGCSPSIRQLIDNTGHVSTSQVKKDLEELEERGKIEFASHSGKSRQIMLGRWTHTKEDKSRATELEWLKWFYQAATFGPGDGDIRDAMAELFMTITNKNLPEGYNFASDGETTDRKLQKRSNQNER